MLSDDDMAFEQWYAENAFDFAANPIGSRDCGLMRGGFAAGIAYAQTWRSMESARMDRPILLRYINDGREVVCIASWIGGVCEWQTFSGYGIRQVAKPTGWLPLPPAEAK